MIEEESKLNSEIEESKNSQQMAVQSAYEPEIISNPVQKAELRGNSSNESIEDIPEEHTGPPA
jgi:hypothetical protein